MLLTYVFNQYTLPLLCASIALALLVALSEVFFPNILPRSVNGSLSKLIDVYLRWKYTIKKAGGRHELPTCPYVWPNGQGDTAKFLEGASNSALWREKNGSLYRIWAGMIGEVVLTKPDQLKSIFQDSDKHVKAVNNDSGYLMSQLLGKCVGLISPPEWQKVRAITEVPFRYQAVTVQTDNVNAQVEEYFASMAQNLASNLSRERIHPAQDLKMLPFWIVAQLFYGKLPADLLARLQRLAPVREDLMKYVIQGGLSRFSWSRHLPTTANKVLNRFQSEWTQFNQDVVRYCRSNNPESPILAMYQAVEDGKLSQAQWLQTLDEALYANLDVTTGGLSWNLVFLAANPHCQQKLREELLSLTDPAAVDKYLQDSKSYLQACILESSRLKPLAAFSVPQSAPTDRVVDGYLIPAHTNIVVDAYAMNIHNEHWAPDNEVYRPERFLDVKGSELRYLFWRFGFGPRRCMGMYAADLMIRATLRYIVLRYDLSLIDPKTAWAVDKHCWITHPDTLIRCVKR